MKRDKWGFRAALRLAVMLWVAPAGLSLQAADGPRWFRGQLHAHTYWSDGRGFPEQAVEAFRQRGYQFLCLTDHNRFADDTNAWRKVVAQEGTWPPKVTQAVFDSYVEMVGEDWADIKTSSASNGVVTQVRLKTYAEIKARYEDPANFILLPGVEYTQTVNGYAVHMNGINLPAILPCIKGGELIKNVKEPVTVSALIGLNAAEAEQARRMPYLLMLNHPFWVYYDVLPRNLIDNPAVRFFEICNNGSDHAPHPDAPTYTPEKFWDAVNAFRCLAGQPLLYGIGSDDTHYYDASRIDGAAGVGDAWVMVRAAALTPVDLLAAMHKGDFYASSGVLLAEAAFTPDDNTLRVTVKEEQGVHYRIQFISTKRGFDRNVTEVVCPVVKGRPARTIPVYSDDIGRIVKTAAGPEAEYRLEADDLYVRARVESDRPSKITAHFHPKVQMAWTQPFTADGSISAGRR